jgi:hypothetical protein
MLEEPTTVIIQRYLDVLPSDAAGSSIRELLERAVGKLRLLCGTHLNKSYPSLTRPPVNLQTYELLDGVVAGRVTTPRTTRPPTVRRFFALANQHMRWQLNDLVRRLEEQPAAVGLDDGRVPAPTGSGSVLSPDGRRMLDAIDRLPDDEREVFSLVPVQPLTQGEADEVLGVSSKTVRRRLNRSPILLARELNHLRTS